MLQSSMHMKNALPTLAGILAFGTATAQIGITTTMTPNDLVQNVLLGTGVVISNVTFNGQPGNVINDQFGSFDGENCNVGIDYSVLLANGSVTGAAGSNRMRTSMSLPGWSSPRAKEPNSPACATPRRRSSASFAFRTARASSRVIGPA